MSTLKTGALRGTSGTADSVQLHASDQSVTFPGAVTITGALTSSTTSLGPSYATGTWSPTFDTASGAVGTYQHQIGRYIKIGNLCFCSIYVQAQKGDGSGNTKINNLPFTAVNSGKDQFVGSFGWYIPGGSDDGTTAYKDWSNSQGLVGMNSTNFKMYYVKDNKEDSAWKQFQWQVCSSSYYIRISHNFCYETA